MQTWVETFAAAAGAFLFVLVCVLLLVFSAVYYKFHYLFCMLVML